MNSFLPTLHHIWWSVRLEIDEDINFINSIEHFSPNTSSYQMPKLIAIECRQSQRNLFEILLNQTEIRLYLRYTDWFGTANGQCRFVVPFRISKWGGPLKFELEKNLKTQPSNLVVFTRGSCVKISSRSKNLKYSKIGGTKCSWED